MGSRLPEKEFSDEQLAELAALADGSLPPEQRAILEARVAASPRLRELLDEQERAAAAVRGREEMAPPSLRARVRALRGEERSRSRRRVVIGAALVATATALALALVLPAGEPSGPTVAEAAVPTGAAPTGPAPRPYADRPSVLRAEVDEVEFPNWARGSGWRPSGTRTDRVRGRDTTTVFYERGGRRIAYTIVSGTALSEPKAAARSIRAGTPLRTLALRGRLVVTWRREGHTCILSGAGVPADELSALAAWRQGGAGRY